MVVIAVHGTAVRLLPAELGAVRVALEHEHDDRADAVRRVAALHERLSAEAAAAAASGAAARWSADQVRVRAEHRWQGDGLPERVVQVATAEVRVTFQDLDALSAWVERAGAEPGVRLEGIEWSATDGALARAQRAVRVAAVQDATARAAAYAEALGGGGAVLQALWEDGLRPASSGPAGAAGWTVQAQRASAEHAGLLLRPAEIEVRADLTADFVLEDASSPDQEVRP